MLRRIHVSSVHSGEIEIDAAQSHHLRNVLRLRQGTEIELFDADGNSARATLRFSESRPAVARVVEVVRNQQAGRFRFIVAAAVPKSSRADWMIEKLSEIGVDAFIPLATERGVVLPEGTNKRRRWQRLAAESARQSRRTGVMRIDELTPLGPAVARLASRPDAAGWYGSTGRDAEPIARLVRGPLPADLTLFIGPEGGWTDAEVSLLQQSGLTAVRLTETILRIETAAVAAAAIVTAFAPGPDDG